MNKLIGIVACGGKSSRMGQDKSLLNYHGKSQRYYVYDLLSEFCDAVFISCNREQASEIAPNYCFIVDDEEYASIGPMAALLSAHKEFPDADFVLLGCDYPCFSREDVIRLLQKRNEAHAAICYFNPETQWPEPLLAVYQPSCFPLMILKFAENKFSLRHLLLELNAKYVVAPDMQSIMSIDTMDLANRVVKGMWF